MKFMYAAIVVVCGVMISTVSAHPYMDSSEKYHGHHANGHKPPPREVKGYVFLDMNKNGLMDRFEPGIPDVCVSNGKDVTVSGRGGKYTLPALDEMVVFISKPAGYTPPLNKYDIPQFSYIHQPDGSPAEIRQYEGIAPTGDLPENVNFPLYREAFSRKFRAVITGDIQTYTDREIEYFRNSTVKEISGMDAACIISMGDNVGDNLSLYPHLFNSMCKTGMPVWLVPGNHDANYDANDPQHAFETFKRCFGPTYYSFDYGEVHFVVLNDICYPAPEYLPSKTYHGEIDSIQMLWLANDLAHVSRNKLIVLNMHIPIVSDVDHLAPKHNVKNRDDLYALLEGRRVVALAGHTHTIDNFLPGELIEGWETPLQIPEVIVGASCGSWWSGDLDCYGVPMSYQRDGAPRGYQLWDFAANRYNYQFKATGKDISEQMNLSFMTPSFKNWFSKQLEWATTSPSVRDSVPPYTLNDLPDQGSISRSDFDSTLLIANIWNGSNLSRVKVLFDDNQIVYPVKNDTIGDPFAQRLQAYVFRYAMGFNMFATANYGPAAPEPEDASNIMTCSYHIWSCKLPPDLEAGKHVAEVRTTDMCGNTYSQKIAFEVVE